MLSHVIPQCLVTDRIPIKLQLTGKSRLIFKFFRSVSHALSSTFNPRFAYKLERKCLATIEVWSAKLSTRVNRSFSRDVIVF